MELNNIYLELIDNIKYELLEYLNINELINLSEKLNNNIINYYLNKKIDSFQKINNHDFLNLHIITKNCKNIYYYDRTFIFENKSYIKTILNKINQNYRLILFDRILYSLVNDHHNIIFEDGNPDPKKSIKHVFSIWNKHLKNNNNNKINMYYLIEGERCIIIHFR